MSNFKVQIKFKAKISKVKKTNILNAIIKLTAE
jgi:hypothetical protein